jgi:hypothetical protein
MGRKKIPESERMAHALKYENIATLRLENKSLYDVLSLNHMIEAVKSKMDGRYNSKWNYTTIMAEAIKYSRKIDFFRNAQSAYNRAKKLGIFDEVTQHMPDPYKLAREANLEIQGIGRAKSRYNKDGFVTTETGVEYRRRNRIRIDKFIYNAF